MAGFPYVNQVKDAATKKALIEAFKVHTKNETDVTALQALLETIQQQIAQLQSTVGGGGTTTITTPLSDTGVAQGSYGDTTHVGTFTVNAQGRLTAAANAAIAFPADVDQPIPITFCVPGTVATTATDIMAVWFRVTRPNGDTFKLGKIHVTAKTQGTTTEVHFDVLRSANNGSSWSTIFSGDAVKLPTGVHVNNQNAPSYAITDLNDGDLLRVDLTQADPAAMGILVQIFPT